MKIKQALKISYYQLRKIPSPQLEAEFLISHILKRPREWVLSHGEMEFSKPQIANYILQIIRRTAGVPLAYVTKGKEFYGLKFKVNKHVLIPRPETELMVDEVIELTRQVKHVTLIDVGTGSGCIIISIMKHLSPNQLDTGIFVASDNSKEALAMAQKNAELHQLDKKIKFYNGDLLQPILSANFQIPNSKIIISANLPYLTPQQYKESATIQNEPKSALIGGHDGLKYYGRLIKQIEAFTKANHHLKLTIFCEIDPDQKISLTNLVESNLPKFTIKIKKDPRGHDRLAIINFSV